MRYNGTPIFAATIGMCLGGACLGVPGAIVGGLIGLFIACW
jgi:hypothetical protein